MKVRLDHDKWLKKFNKSRQGKMFNLLYDIQMAKSDFKLISEDSVLSHLRFELYRMAGVKRVCYFKFYTQYQIIKSGLFYFN